MSLPEESVAANTLPEVTTIPTGKKLIFTDPDTNEGGIITLENLSKQILQNLTSQTFALDQGNLTLLQALNQLNSNTFSTRDYVIKSIESVEKTGFYIGNFVKGHSWQIGLVLIQQDKAGVFIAIDSIECLLFIGSRENKNGQWKIKQIS